MIRPATERDSSAIVAIYNHYVLHSVATFEEEPVSPAEMARRIADCDGPWLVLEDGVALLGYAYAKPFHARSAYRHSFESTIYLHHAATGAGRGQQLYGALLETLAQRPIHRVIGAISLPNAASVALHERSGFVKVGHLTEVGRKLGAWVDVGYWERALPGPSA